MNIGIVILNFKSYLDTIKLVEALQHQTIANNFHIVVVDNCSPNESFNELNFLSTKHSNVVVLQTEKNLGYAQGNNFGLDYLNKYVKPMYVAILNNDIILPNDSFEQLVTKYIVLDKPAIIAPRQLNANNEEFKLYSMNSFLDDCLSLFFITRIFNKRKVYSYKDNSGQDAMIVDMIPGSFMFTDFNIFKSMGFFYPNTFLYAEERFISVKAKTMQLNNYILIKESYIHLHSKTISNIYSKPDKYKLLYNSWLEFTRICRSHGHVKAKLLKILTKLSLVEIRIIYLLRRLFKV